MESADPGAPRFPAGSQLDFKENELIQMCLLASGWRCLSGTELMHIQCGCMMCTQGARTQEHRAVFSMAELHDGRRNRFETTMNGDGNVVPQHVHSADAKVRLSQLGFAILKANTQTLAVL